MDLKRSLEVAGVGFAVVVAAWFAGQWALEGAVHSRRQVQVPDLRKKSTIAALDALAPLNLPLRKDGSEFDASVPAGAVLRQIPPPGTTVREGKAIRVILSQGGESVFVPSVVGLPLRNAEMMLRQKELLLGQVSESYSLKAEKGIVLTQDPPGEASAEKHALVNVVVSGGAPPSGITLMPDFRQRAATDARAWADARRVPLELALDKESPFPDGMVLAQDPAPDTLVSEDVKLLLTVSGRAGEAEDPATTKRLRYELSQGGSESLVRIVVVDSAGEREVFNGLRKPGTKIDISIPQTGQARARIFINGILVEEKELR